MQSHDPHPNSISVAAGLVRRKASPSTRSRGTALDREAKKYAVGSITRGLIDYYRAVWVFGRVRECFHLENPSLSSVLLDKPMRSSHSVSCVAAMLDG